MVLVWVVLWFLVTCGFFHFGNGDKDINVPIRPSDGNCGFCGSVVLPSMPKPMIARMSCASEPPHVVLWVGGLALDAEADDCASDRAHVVLWVGGLSLDSDACQWSCASTCPQVLRVLWVPLLPKDRARSASVG